MKVTLYLKSRSNAFSAESIYEDGKIIVKKGSVVSLTFADHIRGGKRAKSYLNNDEYVDHKVRKS